MPNTPLRTILYIEDDAGLATLLKRRFERIDLSVMIASSAENGFEILKTQNFDLILVDFHLPGMNGLEFIENYIKDYGSQPLILLTAGGNEHVAIAALELGASDYAVKDVGQVYLELLPQIMQSAFTKDRLAKEYEKQKKELEQAQDNAEIANNAKAQFLATLSHEIRTPLNVITGLIHTLGIRHKDDEDSLLIQTISNNSNILMRLINDLLDVTKFEQENFILENISFKLSDLLENIENSYIYTAIEKNISFTINNDCLDLVYFGDKYRLNQILTNLVSNAFKFTNKGSIAINAKITDLHLIIEVKDTGIGIPQENISKIFEKFNQADTSITRKFGGTGLGLSIAKNLCNIMGGEIIVESKLGIGTSFILNLPLKLGEINNEIVPIEHQTINQNGNKILIVEDYEPNIMVLELFLQEFGYEYISVKSGEEAISLINAKTHKFYCILLDIEMGGIDGFETAKKIRQVETYHNYIIGVTAHGLSGDKENCIKAGMDNYVAKPINPEALEKVLAERKN